jgi:putative hemolysin
MPVDPFSLDPPSSLAGRARSIVARSLLSRLAGLDEVRAAYEGLTPGPAETFLQRALEALAVETSIDPLALTRIPEQGPLIVSANHPRGALDGLVLASVVARVRPDVRLVANHLLARIPEMRSICFFVDPFGGPSASARSLSGLRAAHLWLRRGGALILFPAGEVAHRRDAAGQPRDGAWSDTLGRLASGAGAAVVPAFIDGSNSEWFYSAGRLHPLLRTLMLPRELLRARRSQVAVRIGRAIEDGTGANITVRARQAVERLSTTESSPASELATLPPDARLLQSGRFDVYHAEAHDIPATLHEIGRLRAVTFRAAGEGTLADIDLDRFDRHYVHLLVWDREQRCVVGAYRIGRTDRIVRQRGVDGLYTRTLFRYDTSLIDALAPALELGRSFVRLEYQRDYQPLLLLWRGIGQYVVRHPEYRCLFGPVSISARYGDASRALMTAFLERHHRDGRLARLAEPLHPGTAAAGDSCSIPSTVAEADKAVAAQEADGKGLPVLLRQYLKLGARTISVSVDPAFGNVIDALMAVDLTTTNPAVLRKYVGDDGLAAYSSQHSRASVSPAA